MKVNELTNTMNQNKAKLLKAEQISAFLKKELEVKDYLSIKVKKALVEDIVDTCILYEDGVFKFDEIEKYIYFTMKTIATYTNIELSDDIEDDYDMLCESKLLEVIISTFKKEYDDISILLGMKTDYILSRNALESQLGKFLDNTNDLVETFVGALTDKINNFNVNKEDLQMLIKLMQLKK